ncbi:MAG: carboxypeptidase regulatory-like domain-containing protein [Thermoanaerobaculum sp.]
MTLTLTTGTTLAVRVVDERGTPLVGVKGGVRREKEGTGFRFRLGRQESPMAEAESDGEGKLVFPSLLPGSYGLTLEKPGYVPTHAAVNVPPEGKDLGDVTLPSGVSLAGRVVDESGQGVPEVTVLAGSNADFPMDYDARTQSDGSFVLADLPREGLLYVQVRSRLYASSPIKVTMPPTGPVEIKVKAGKVLRGRVVDKETGAAIADAQIGGGRVLIRSIGGFRTETVMPISGGTSDADGFFEVPLTGAGDVRLEVRATGYAPAQRTLAISENETPRLVVVQLERGFTLRGVVWEADGRPAVGVTVAVSEAGKDLPSRFFSFGRDRLTTTTDGNGEFALVGLKAGKMTVEAESPEGQRDRVTVDVTGDTQVELRLASPSDLEVRVVGPGGEPRAGAKVQALSWGSADLPPKFTDGSGLVRFEDVASGTYSVVATLEGYVSAEERVTVGGQPARVTLKLSRGGEIVGVVRGLSPQELGRCQVWAGPARTQVSADGSFRLQGVPLGRQEITATVFPLGRAKHTTVEVREGVPAQVELDFSQGYTLSGVVRRGSQGVSGYTVTVGGPTPMDRASDTTDERGSFTLRGLETGRWQLAVSDPNGQVLLTREVEVHADTQVELSLPEGTITGTVARRTTREPVDGAEILLEIPGQSAFIRRTTSDEQGNFSFRELPPDTTYRILAQAPGYSPAEGSVTLKGLVATVELFLDPQKVLELWVRDADGSIPAEVYLLVRGSSGETQVVFVTLDREGRGIVGNLPAGSYTALVQGQGAAVAAFEVPSQVRLQLLPRASLVVDAGQGSVLVQVVTEAGLPVALRFRGLGEEGPWVTVRGSQRFTLPAGAYRLLIQRPAGVEEKTVNLVPGQETLVEVGP